MKPGDPGSDTERMPPTYAYILRRRSLVGRLIRLPKLIAHNWRFAKNCKLWDRITICAQAVKLILRGPPK